MIFGAKQTVDGNREVVQFLEHWLEKAKGGDIDHLALIACRGPSDGERGYAGVAGREAIVCFTMDYLRLQIMGDYTNRMNPPSINGITADKWAYNLGRSPTSYDFMTWLVNAEMMRVREGAPFPLKVAFYVGKDGDLRNALHSDFRVQTFVNIIRPALAFVGAIESAEAQNGRTHECFSFALAVEAFRNGEKVPVFKSPMRDDFCRGLSPVVITLRECDRQPHRNSNVEEWLKFARYLRERGEIVVFVRDTDKAHEPIQDFKTYPVASINIHVRLALYEKAKCNLFVANGPVTLAFFTQVPWLMFAAPNPTDSYYPNTPDGWRKFVGISPGEQLPWARDNQRIVWQADTFEVMRDAWEGLGRLQAAA